MSTTLFLVRHASHSQVDRVLVGRTPGVGLSRVGVLQARALAERLAARGITHVQSSPRQRALETAIPIAARLGLEVEIAAALDEIDYGEWSGREFAALQMDPRWLRWNSDRACARPPGGESMAEAQCRALAHLQDVERRAGPDGRVAMVTHAEVIRAVILRCCGQSVSAWDGIDVRPASVTVVTFRAGRPTLRRQQEVRPAA